MKTKKLGFGCMRLPLLHADDAASVDFETVCKMVDTFLSKGFTYFDTAYMYHNFQSEVIVRKALVERHARDTFTLTSKLPTMFLKTEADMERIFQEQLEKCGVSYFDYYLLHNLGVNHYEIAEKLNSFAFIAKKKAEGKVKHIGFSFHDRAELLDEILTAHPEIEVVQLQINYLDWDNDSIQSKKCYETACQHHKKVIVMEPVKGGTLAAIPTQAEMILKAYHPHHSIASWAIRYAASLDQVMMVLSGMSTMEQLEDNISYMKDFQPLTIQEDLLIQQAVQIIQKAITIPCTGCQYCVDGCPKRIPIPQYFALYNAEQQAINQGFSTQSVYYKNLIKNHGKASACIGCQQCMRSCPQHIDCIHWLKEITKTFEGEHK